MVNVGRNIVAVNEGFNENWKQWTSSFHCILCWCV